MTTIEKNQLDLHHLPKSSYPWLIHSINGEEGQTFYNKIEGDSFTAKISLLNDKHVWSFPGHGWWIVQDGSNTFKQEYFLLNPLTMETILLPTLECSSGHLCRVCVLSHSPDNPNCRFMLYVDGCILFCRIGDDEFINHNLADGDFLSCATSINGIIYGLSRYSGGGVELISICFQDESLEVMEVIRYADMMPPEVFKYDDYLIEHSNGEILYVHKNYSPCFHWEVMEFKIFKVNLHTTIREEVKSIGAKHAIFLDEMKGMCVKIDGQDIDVEKGVEGDCIYFVQSHSCHLHVYDLRDGTTSTLPLSSSAVANYDKHKFSWVLHSKLLGSL